MPTAKHTLTSLTREYGFLGLLDMLWARGCQRLSQMRLSALLGRLRNLWRLPQLLRKFRGGKLNLGCGPDRRPGWLNADLDLRADLYLHAGRRFPLPDNFLALIFTEHMLEHLSEAEAATCLWECHRVLQPGGILRLSTPDLAHVVADYLAPPAATVPQRRSAAAISPWKYPEGTVPTPAQVLNDGFRLWEHQHLWDETDLREALQRAGFVEVQRYEPGQGSSELTSDLESRRDAVSMVVEARKQS